MLEGDAPWLLCQVAKPVLAARLARMPSPGLHDPWRLAARKDVLAAIQDLPELEPIEFGTYNRPYDPKDWKELAALTKPTYTLARDPRPATPAFWPEAMLLGQLQPLLQRRFLAMSGEECKAGLRAVLAKLGAAGGATTPKAPRTTTFAAIRLVGMRPEDSSSNATTTTTATEVVLFSGRALPGGRLGPTPSLPADQTTTDIMAYLGPSDKQALVWTLVTSHDSRLNELRHALPTPFLFGNPDKKPGQRGGTGTDNTDTDTTVAPRDQDATTTAGKLRVALPHLKPFLDTHDLKVALWVVLGACHEHKAGTVVFPLQRHFVWGIRAANHTPQPAAAAAVLKSSALSPTQLETEADDDKKEEAEPAQATGIRKSDKGDGSLAVAITAPSTPARDASSSPSPSPSLPVVMMMATTTLPMEVLGQVLRENAAKASSGSLYMSPAARRKEEEERGRSRVARNLASTSSTTTTAAPTTTTTTTIATPAQPARPRPRQPLPWWMKTRARYRFAMGCWHFITRILPLLILAEILRYHVHLGMKNRAVVRAAVLRRRQPGPGSAVDLINLIADLREGDPGWPARCGSDPKAPCPIQHPTEEWMKMRSLDPDRSRRFFGIKDEDDKTLTPRQKGEEWWWKYL